MIEEENKKNVIYKRYTYRLYPNKEQEQNIIQTLGSCRFVYNYYLENTLKEYKEQGVKFNYKGIKEHFSLILYSSEYNFLSKVSKSALNNSLKDLNKAYQNFFKNSKRYGFPAFKRKHCSTQSFTINTHDKNLIKGNRVKITRIGEVRFKKHREFPENYKIDSITIVKKASGIYFIVFDIHYDKQIIKKKTIKTSIGLDFSIKSFYVDNNGNSPNFNGFKNKQKEKYEKEFKKLKRMKNGSNNYKKQMKKIAKINEKVVNQRRHFLHIESNKLSDLYDCVCVEDLNMLEIAKDKRFNFSIKDIGWGTFVILLNQKLENKGKYLIKIDRFFPSSQLCNNCGYLNKDTKDLNLRDWTCPQCGIYHDRDINAAKNILNEGLRIFKTI